MTKRNGSDDGARTDKGEFQKRRAKKLADERAAKKAHVEGVLQSTYETMASDPGFQMEAKRRAAEVEMAKRAAGPQLFQPGDRVKYVDDGTGAIPQTWVGRIIDHEWYFEYEGGKEVPYHYYNVRWLSDRGEYREGFYEQGFLVSASSLRKNPPDRDKQLLDQIEKYNLPVRKMLAKRFGVDARKAVRAVEKAVRAGDRAAACRADHDFEMLLTAGGVQPKDFFEVQQRDLPASAREWVRSLPKDDFDHEAASAFWRRRRSNPEKRPKTDFRATLTSLFNGLIARAAPLSDGGSPFPRPVCLKIDDDTALAGRRSARACAAADDGCVYVARKLVEAGDLGPTKLYNRQWGVLMHELAHVSLLQRGIEHDERQADVEAARLWPAGTAPAGHYYPVVFYDDDDVQTADPRGRAPRPAHLPNPPESCITRGRP